MLLDTCVKMLLVATISCRNIQARSCLDEDAADAGVVGGLLERAADLRHALGAAKPPLPLLADGAAQLPSQEQSVRGFLEATVDNGRQM